MFALKGQTRSDTAAAAAAITAVIGMRTPSLFEHLSYPAAKLDPKPAPLLVFAAEFLPPKIRRKKIWLAVFAVEFSSSENPPKKFGWPNTV